MIRVKPVMTNTIVSVQALTVLGEIKSQIMGAAQVLPMHEGSPCDSGNSE